MNDEQFNYFNFLMFSSNVISVIGPKVLKRGEAYRCAATNYDLTRRISLNISLTGFTDVGKEFLVLSELVTLEADRSKTISFKVIMKTSVCLMKCSQ